MSEFRRDPIIGRWVIISTDRGRRPTDFKRDNENAKDKSCPFCSGNEQMTPPEILVYKAQEGSKDGYWSVRVVPNKYPALAVEGSLDRKGEGIYDRMTGIGAHEVIIETPNHNKHFHEHDVEHIESIFWAYKERIIDLKRDFRMDYILIFKNHGSLAGATLAHPHSQLIATPIVPKRVMEEVSGSRKYFEFKDRCGFCDMISEELASTQRMVAENDEFIAFCPYASRFPFETWVMPKTHRANYEYIDKSSSGKLAAIMKTVMGKLYNVLDNPPYNYIIHTSPLKEVPLPHFHWHIEIIPKLTQVAGFEWGTGFYINPTAPEEAAKFLRESD